MWQVLLGGGLVLTGVLLAEWLARGRDRVERVRANVLQLAFSTAIFTSYYSEHPDSPVPDSDYSGPYWSLRESVYRMLGELRYLPQWPMRNAKEIRETAETMLTLLTAVELRFHQGQLLTLEEQAAISLKNNLHSLTFGLGVTPQDKLKKYTDHGFDEIITEMWEKFDDESAGEEE